MLRDSLSPRLRHGSDLLGHELVRRLLQVEDDLQEVLLLSGDLVDHPQHAVLVLPVLLHLSVRVGRQRDRAGCRVVRRVQRDEHVVRLHVRLELRSHLQNQLDLRLALLLHQRADRERLAERRRDAVVARVELSLGRREVQQALRLELVQLHALVEVHVVHDDEVVRRQRATRLVLRHRNRSILAHHQVLRQQHAHGRTAVQEGTHRDRAVDRLRQNLALQVCHHVQTLEHVHVQLVHLLLLVAIRNHRLIHVANHVLLNLTSPLHSYARILHHHRLVEDVARQSLTRRVLRISKVLAVTPPIHDHNCLIQKLVDQRDVLTNSLLRQHATIVLNNLHDSVQQLDAESGRHVHLHLTGDHDNHLRVNHKVQSVLLCVDVRDGSANLHSQTTANRYKHGRRVAVRPGTNHTEELFTRCDGSVKTD